MPSQVENITLQEVHHHIKKLISSLAAIEDKEGKFVFDVDGMTIDTKSWNGWDWTQGIGLYGMWHYYQMTNDQETWSNMSEWFERKFREGTVPKNINTMSPFLTLAYMYEATKDRRYVGYLDTWAEWAVNDLHRTKHGGLQHVTYLSDNHNHLWDDTLMMTVMPLTKIGQILNRPQYVEEAKKQFLLHLQFLSDRKTGLYYHGFTFEGNHNFANALWARGNSWLTIVLPEFLELLDLPESDGFRQYLIEMFRAQCEALVKCQDEEAGMWHTLLDDPTSYCEASATAGFAYGILKGIRLKLLPKEYMGCAVKAIKSVIANIGENGELENTSFGTDMGRNLQFYKDIPITPMPYGQAMAIMALGEFLKLYL
ncbi:hypothetical protein TRVA0_042S00342 [Trichomonascus vanleenenianus]|uniref:glycoside hydrolase family 88/105 protein n=1 Tax=Trichomonascus vanleenenianus TaxID=2268995 RepID=UPI003ECB9FDF